MFVTGRRNVEAKAGLKFYTWRAEMQLNAIFVCVSHPKAGISIGVQSSKGDLFKLIDHLVLLIFRGRILGRKTYDARFVRALISATINQINYAVWIATQHLRQRIAYDCFWVPKIIADQIAIFVIR